jgi:hypothetical protein
MPPNPSIGIGTIGSIGPPPLTIKTVAIDQNGPAIPSEVPRKPWLRTRGVPQRLVECLDSGGRLTGQFSETEELTTITKNV